MGGIMNVRAHMSMLFHLDKCIGCHTCSVACKNLWTDRKGAEYMWWNNVETRPGTGYPTQWEDQQHYRGGWKLKDGKLRLRLHSKLGGLAKLFFNPALPALAQDYPTRTIKMVVPQGPGSGGSVTVNSVAPAVRLAAHGARKQLFAMAAPLLGAKPEELGAAKGRIFVASTPAKAVDFKQVACADIGTEHG